jgi:hypothetical protein
MANVLHGVIILVASALILSIAFIILLDSDHTIGTKFKALAGERQHLLIYPILKIWFLVGSVIISYSTSNNKGIPPWRKVNIKHIYSFFE